MPSELVTRRVRAAAGVTVLSLLAGACSAAPERFSAGLAAADASARVPVATYRSVVRGYVSQRPVEPVSWQQQNERVAPGNER